MGIKFYQKSETIFYADGQGEVTVRGLTVPEISVLVAEYKTVATDLFDKFTGRDPNSLTVADAGTVASELLMTFPGIMAHIVAIGADAVDQFDDVARLPLDVQVAALEKIAEFTFTMSGGFTGFLQLVLRLATNAGETTTSLKNLRASTNGFGDSVLN